VPLQLELGEERVDVRLVLVLAPDGGHEFAVAAAVGTERQMDVEVPNGAPHARLRGRATSSPPQFGHTSSIAAAQSTQKVHSYEQIVAGPSGASADPHRSHASRSSSATLISSPSRG
jgi:hypothetical protein